MLLKVEKELKPMARGYGVSPSGTKAKLVERILEHEMKTLAMTSEFNEQDVVDGASSWRKARSVTEAKEKEGENWTQTERSRMMKDTHGYKSCLLYTSPSPRDATLSRMPSSA